MARKSGTYELMPGVTITATRQDATEPNFSVQTDTFGQYQINDVPAGATYKVTASKSGYTFTPTEITVEMTGDMQDINFTGTPLPTPSGTLTANPNPIQVCDGTGQGVTTLSWTTSNVTSVQVRAGAPNGTLVGSGGPSGNVTTGKWVTNGTVFYLQNVSNGLPLTSANTLATRTVGVITTGCTFNNRINYAYNSVGALSGVGTDLIGSDPNTTTNVLNSLTFRANGAIKSLNYGNGRRLQMGYNANRQQPISMKVDRVSNPSDKVLDYVYEYYDPEGKNNNRIRKMIDGTDGAYTTEYIYDDYNRLTNATAGAYFKLYDYDRWGNMVNNSAVVYNYVTNASGAPATNRIISDGQGVNFSYDAAGNLTQVGVTTNAYDGAGRLKSVNGTANTYGYDGDGGRARVTSGGAAVFYVRSSVLGQVAMEVTSTGVRRAYVYAGNKLVAQQSADGQFYWLHTNHLGSGRAMTDVNGNLVYRGQFDPYGKTLTEWSSSGNANLNTKKFTGYERDVTGLDYANARMYNSGRGRFMQPDPAGMKAANLKLPQTLNQYSYVGNDPVNLIDRGGLFAESAQCFLTGFGGGEGWGWAEYRCYGVAPLLDGPIAPPLPPPEISTCTVTLGSRGLNIPGLQSLVHHMFITTQTWSTNQSKNESTPTVFQGIHPDEHLRVQEDPFQKGNEDFDQSRNPGAIFVSVEFDGTCDEVNASLRATMDKINDANIKYELPILSGSLNPKNSNAAAYTLLQRWSPTWREALEEKYKEKSQRPFTDIVPGWGNLLVK